MARELHKLSPMRVKNLKRKPEEGRYGDGGGLILRITKTGASGWVFRYMVRGTGKITEHGLGSLRTVSLAEARDKAAHCRQLLADGIDPRKAAEPEEAGEAPATFGQCADWFFKEKEARWQNEKARYKWRRSLTETCAPIRDKPVADIDTQDVLNVLFPVWTRTPHSGTRLRGRIEAVLEWAASNGYRDGVNPARYKGHLEHKLPEHPKKNTRHQPAMKYTDVPAFMQQLQARDAIAARGLEFLILTGCRTSEILNAKWTEIDFDAAVWTIPAGRMKMGEEHQVPLSGRAVAILRELQEIRVSDFVFPGQKADRPPSNMVFTMLMRRMKIENAVPHGFRSSFRDWAGEETTYDTETCEAALAHKTGNDTVLSYRRLRSLKKRRPLMQEWADFCAGTATDNVVQLHS